MVGLYVHIPFCKQKCLYCDFASFANVDNLMDEYIDALIKEIKEKTQDIIIKSLFIGGGTPSHLNNNSLKKLMDCLKSLNYIEDAEKTIECNPGTLTKEKLLIIKEGGINRLSFGLQSTDDAMLKRIGRIHTYKEFEDNYLLARSLGFSNINIDMMFGLPNQKVEDIKKSLSKVLSLNPDHISAYSLIIEEGTPFYEMYNKELIILPNEDEERLMYYTAKEMLIEHGFHQYEISNYAKENKECYHNKLYWKCDEYLGVGVAASSFIKNTRKKNISSIREYINRIQNNQGIIEEEYVNTINDSIEEFMFMNLRMLEGLSEEEFERRFNKKVDDVYSEIIKKHIQNGLLIRKEGRIFLSNKGIELSNYVMSDMILN